MKDRLKKLRNEERLTQQEFADKIGIQRGTYAKYEVGRNEPIDAVIKLICSTFNVNEKWLRTGEGDMFSKISRDDEIQRLVDEMLKDDSAEIKRRLVAAILRLTPEQIQTGVNWINETFGIAADQKKREIDQKVEEYREELENEAASDKSEVLHATKDA